MSATTWSPDWVLSLNPYQPGKPIEEVQRELGLSSVVKLASNENPLGPPQEALAAIAEAGPALSLYPDAATFKLRQAISERYKVPMGELAVGNGSNEMITLLCRAFLAPGKKAVAGEYAFIAYRLCVKAAGGTLTSVPMPSLKADLPALAAACDDDTQLVFVANPNNPTGTWHGREELEAFLKAVPEHVLVVLDEAYTEYVDPDTDCPDALELRGLRENLVVLRTFSKAWGLAGLRCGFAVASPEVLDRINRVREPFNSNTLAQVAAEAALGAEKYIQQCAELNRKVRAELSAGVEALGLEAVESQTNFVLVKVPMPGVELYTKLLHKGVIVRPLVPYGLHDYVRISVGTEEENACLLKALAEVIDESRS